MGRERLRKPWLTKNCVFEGLEDGFATVRIDSHMEETPMTILDKPKTEPKPLDPYLLGALDATILLMAKMEEIFRERSK